MSTESAVVAAEPSAVDGRFVVEDGVEWYRIDDYDRLDPFLITVVAPDDQWIYASSSGALTAGRGSADRALFSYETDDRLHRLGGIAGPVTIVRVGPGGTRWQPFAPWGEPGTVRRSLAKSTVGDRLRFEEYHPELGLTFQATWSTAGPLGLVRQCQLSVDDDRGPVPVEILDGLLDVLPAQVELALQQSASTLVDSFRRSELVADHRPDRPLALYTLESLVTDHADPAEALTANAVWSTGLPDPTVVLSDRPIGAFRAGRPPAPEPLVTGRKGAFLVSASSVIGPGSALRWVIGADVGLDHGAVAQLRQRLDRADDLLTEVDREVASATDRLAAIVAAADGQQETRSRAASVHHHANTLFNIMRGGFFLDDHRVDLGQVARFVGDRNGPAAERFGPLTDALDPVVAIDDLRAAVVDDADLTRLVAEYLPLAFSRRHGDPSRPWNRFSIPPVDPDGQPARGYEGNWRDIFQNWEALVHSYPAYAESVVAKFLNASTLDGHNPYRITDRGIDWEEPDEGSWGNFGYWGDHQIVYLHRLLESLERFQPGRLAAGLDQRVFSYADVPYRLAAYDDLVADPKRTLTFDDERQAAVDRRVALLGADGRLVPDGARLGGGRPSPEPDSDPVVHHATLAEKLLVPALAKLSNLVAGAGIWLNTQRPEWNDANNALVGNGVSTVTLFHLRHYLGFVDDLLADRDEPVRIARSVLTWLDDLDEIVGRHDPTIPVGPDGDPARRALLDDLGRAFERYRHQLDVVGLGPPMSVPVDRLRRFLATVRPHLDHAAAEAVRPDGLYHSYWLLQLEPSQARLEPLYEMLEGQAAALVADGLGPEAANRLIDVLFESDLHREDQGSFVLYPNRPPAPFLDKNSIPDHLATEAVVAFRDAGTGLVVGGADDRADLGPAGPGPLRFGAHLQSDRVLADALDRLADDDRHAELIRNGRAELERAYEAVFRHRSFTGRSQTMYRYEGLGSIYWHMVSKVLAGLQDRVLEAIERGDDATLVAASADRYRRVRAGLGFVKSPVEQGSFPTDPHSHTPAHTGAQQPGMTGQVKEGLLIRWRELGVTVRQGRARFGPVLLDPDEFLAEARAWPPLGPDRRLEPGTLGFTWCGVPVVYHLTGEESWTEVTWADGRVDRSVGPELDAETSGVLFARDRRLERIDVGITRSALL